MIAILMSLLKLATSGHLKKKLFSDKGYDSIVYVYDVTKNVFSCYSNYILHVGIRPRFGNSSISMTELITASTL